MIKIESCPSGQYFVDTELPTNPQGNQMFDVTNEVCEDILCTSVLIGVCFSVNRK